jgi:beta-lactamase regulating signal transducer with metallopeptidase domain
MLAWMLYAILASVLIGAAALALERVAHALRRPTRFVWLGALVLSVAWPVAMWFSPRAAAERPSLNPVQSTLIEGVHVASQTVATASARALDIPLETVLIAAWIALSVWLLVRVAVAVRSTGRKASTWRYATVDGVRVRTSPDVGPAVVGIRSMQVVVPEWVLALDRHLRDLVLAHEHEHRQSRDPMLLLAASVVVCLMPWNVALIWQARRLRLALEIDCDSRVLRAYPDAERYARLLLAIAQRRSSASLVLGPTMSEPAINLARRSRPCRTIPYHERESLCCAVPVCSPSSQRARWNLRHQ